MSQVYLSRKAARHLHLAAQGLLKKPRKRAVPADILKTIRQMALLQIDTINIVARSPWIVLFSRLGSFPFPWLEESLSRGELIEYWAHEACFLPKEDFALVRHRMLNPHKMGWKYSAEWMATHEQEIAELLGWMAENGPVRAADFAHPRPGQSGWWEWKPHKRHLEGLFTAGKVMVSSRHNFQRVYDLTHRIMPGWDDAQQSLTQSEAESVMLSRSARCLGIFKPAWLADYYRLKNIQANTVIARWLGEQAVTQVEVEDLGTMWLDNSLLPLLPQAEQDTLNATHSTVLSPFDPVVWDRRRASQLFQFEYRLECYTPAPKRQYGYFVLPVLHRGQIVGRMDAKMHRKTGVLEVMALWLEEGVRSSQHLEQGIWQALVDFARWQGATQITLGQVPSALACLKTRNMQTN